MTLKLQPMVVSMQVALCIGALPGCRRADMDKVVVAGSVTYSGDPVANGEIRFFPLSPGGGPVSGAAIVNGKYEASGKGGVPLGQQRVEIKAFRSSTIATPGGAQTAPGDEAMPAQQYLPDKYNRASSLTVDIDDSERPLTRDFHLEP